MLFDDYVNYTRQYKAEYGPKTLVLMEVGSFWEMYDDASRNGADTKTVSELLNIQVSRKNKGIKEVSRENPLMAGFPSYALKRFLQLLVDDDWTVVLVAQLTQPPQPVVRKVTRIVSKGTYLHEDDGGYEEDAAKLMVVYLASEPGPRKSSLSAVFGAAVVDLSTGACWAHEGASDGSDERYCLDELHRFVLLHRPGEVVLVGPGPPDCLREGLLDSLGLGRTYVHDKLGQAEAYKEYADLHFQEQLLRKVYPKTGMLSVWEFLDLERLPSATVAFVAALQFAYQHDERIVADIERPAVESLEGQLTLSYNAARQLDLAGLDKALNDCCTPMGRRAFRYRLMHPVADAAELERRYQAVAARAADPAALRATREALRGVCDLERLNRRIALGTMTPGELAKLVASMDAARPFLPREADRAACERVAERVEAELDSEGLAGNPFAELGGAQVFTRLFHAGAHPELDALLDSVASIVEGVRALAGVLSGKFPGYFKAGEIEWNERDGYYFTITSKRFKEIEAAFRGLPPHEIGNTSGTEIDSVAFEAFKATTQPSQSYVRLTHPKLRGLSDACMRQGALIRKTSLKLFADFLGALRERHAGDCKRVADAVRDLDVESACAWNAARFGHARPVLVGDSAEKASVDLRGLRHPIVEGLHSRVSYVANDLSLGVPGASQDGVLLYGINSAGKSCLMKAVGLAVIMAQAGMYVAADFLELRPYRDLHTRITQSDDIYRGQSTFVVEMSELRGILRRAGPRSVVLGDELCAGTESGSAVAIVAAGMLELCARGTSFVFATHLHELVQIERVKRLENLKVYHLSVLCDPATKKLVFDRRLREGSGCASYGLEVLKSLDVGPEFMNVAFEVRREILGIKKDILNTDKRSRYNRRHVVDACALCGSTSKIEVHHIVPRHRKDAFRAAREVNRLSNLVNLCDLCHDALHRGEIDFSERVQTSDGVE